MSDKKNKGGRPTKYKDEYAEQAYKYCLLGATNEKLALLFEVAVSTIDKWISEIDEFSGAIKRGRYIADAEVASSLYHRAVGYQHQEVKVFCQEGQIIEHEVTKHYAPDTGAAFIWLKNRNPDKWRDKQEQEIDDSPIGRIQIEVVGANSKD